RRSAARARSITTRSSGLSSWSVVSMSTMPPSARAFAFMVSPYSASFSRSGPRRARSISKGPAPVLEQAMLRTCGPKPSRVELAVALADGLDDIPLRVVASERRQRITVADTVPDTVQAHRTLGVRHHAHVHIALVHLGQKPAAGRGQRD